MAGTPSVRAAGRLPARPEAVDTWRRPLARAAGRNDASGANRNGLGDPILAGRAKTFAAAVAEVAPYLIGKDPRNVVHHWQAIYRHAFYRGGPLLTSVLSGIEQALWDIKGKSLGVPVYELLGGPTRDRVRVYAHVSNDPERLRQRKAQGFTAFKTGIKNSTHSGLVASQKFIEEALESFAALREAGGKEVDIGIDFHGAISPQNAKLLIKALEPYQPMFIEEPVQCQNVDVMAEIARGTHLPIATGERVFTKWGFREILEKGAATILQPDLCHAGGIMEARLIAGMAEAVKVALIKDGAFFESLSRNAGASSEHLRQRLGRRLQHRQHGHTRRPRDARQRRRRC